MCGERQLVHLGVLGVWLVGGWFIVCIGREGGTQQQGLLGAGPYTGLALGHWGPSHCHSCYGSLPGVGPLQGTSSHVMAAVPQQVLGCAGSA